MRVRGGCGLLGIEPFLLLGLPALTLALVWGLPVDATLHMAHPMGKNGKSSGVPMVTHLHGGHNDFQFDGNPEFFFSPNYRIRGPQWVDKKYVYDMSQPAGTVWYHDHALGITRLNVYMGLAAFYLIRDDFENALALPSGEYEIPLVIQDRSFAADGSLVRPASRGLHALGRGACADALELAAEHPEHQHVE